PTARPDSVFPFFFFQAEDGIRDDLVTGVQTCALPIFQSDGGPDQNDRRMAGLLPGFRCLKSQMCFVVATSPFFKLREFWTTIRRSEERRVGKGCGCEV